MKKIKRLWEVDTTRGIAIIMMIISNFILDLAVFAGQNINITSGFWLYFARLTAFLFIFIAGLSLTLSYSRTGKNFRKYFLRGIRIFGWGLLITLLTWFVFPQNTIWFGILHLIGLSIIISYPFLKMKKLNLIIGLLIVFLGFYLDKIIIDSPWLIWLGLKHQGFSSFDYVPLLPWFGVFLIGIFLGNILYPEGKSKLKFSDFSDKLIIRFLTKFGRNSLFIYLIHQPILIGLLILFLQFT